MLFKESEKHIAEKWRQNKGKFQNKMVSRPKLMI